MAGPRPGQTCTVCNHPGIVLINKSILDGQSDYKVAGAFGLARGVIKNHRSKRHPGLEKLGGGPAAPGSGDEWTEPTPNDDDTPPRQRLMSLISRLEHEMAGMDYLKPEIARELRLAYADLEKMASGEAPDSVRIQDVDGLRDLFYEMHRVLERHQDARDEMAEVWRARGIQVEVPADAAAAE